MNMSEKKIYSLRPHHGMCLAYFEGKGYSDGFAAHMGEMLEKLEKEAVLQLVVTGDEICQACPNLQNGTCSTEELVASYDRAVLKLCSLRENEVLKFRDFVSVVQEKILEPGRRTEICGGCQWNEICRNKKSRWK